MSHAATQPTQADARQQLINIRKRLEHWELTHLRALAAELAERLEQAEAERDDYRNRVEAAWDAADMWRDQASKLVDDLRNMGREVGMTQTGQLVTMPTSDGVDIDAVHKAMEAA